MTFQRAESGRSKKNTDKLSPEFLREKYVLLKNFHSDLLLKLKKVKAFIAGGAITSIFSDKKINDYDIYFRTQEDLQQIVKFCLDAKAGKKKAFQQVFETENAVTFKDREEHVYQFIKLIEMVGEPEEVIHKFDYTICMGAYDLASDTFAFHKEFFKHLSQRKLVFQISSHYPLCAIFRLRKFLNKGFSISGSEVIKLALKMNQLSIKSYKDLKKQLQGVDTLFLKELTDALDKPEHSEKEYDFDFFMQWIDEYLNSKYSRFFEDEGEND